MALREKRLISIDSALAKCIDDDIQDIGQGSNFSGWISHACHTKLLIKKGISFKLKYKRLKGELAKQD